MTPEQHRKLDALVAEKVMNGKTPGDWHPSTDIADAWEVVEATSLRYREGLFGVNVCRTAAGNPAYSYDATIYERIYGKDGWATDDYKFCAHAPTAPLAICLAALKAKGVDTKEFEQ